MDRGQSCWAMQKILQMRFIMFLSLSICTPLLAPSRRAAIVLRGERAAPARSAEALVR